MTLALLLLLMQEPVTLADDAKQPHLAADKEGGFYCVYIGGGNILLSASGVWLNIGE